MINYTVKSIRETWFQQDECDNSLNGLSPQSPTNCQNLRSAGQGGGVAAIFPVYLPTKDPDSVLIHLKT